MFDAEPMPIDKLFDPVVTLFMDSSPNTRLREAAPIEVLLRTLWPIATFSVKFESVDG